MTGALLTDAVFPIEVSDGRAVKSRGTGWFVTDTLVVTAFHVVGRGAEWFSSMDPELGYSLRLGGSRSLRLEPVERHIPSDIALLRVGTPVEHTPSTVSASHEDLSGARWSAPAYPTETSGRMVPFVLDGDVSHQVTRRGGVPGKHDLQLYVRQRTALSWGAASGAPVVVAGHVVGVLTDELPDGDTLWATPFSLQHPVLNKVRDQTPALFRSAPPLVVKPASESLQKRMRAAELDEHHFNYTLGLLRGSKDEFWKIAIQDLCLLAEQGFRLSNAQRQTLSEALDPLWTSASYKTRNWIVKAAGLCGLLHFRPHLRDLFIDDATDEESRSWALAAYSQLLGVDRALTLLANCSDAPASFELALQFYSAANLGRLDGVSLLRSMERDDVTAKWVAFYYGYNHPAAATLTAHDSASLVGALTSHHNNSVAEHALWALHRAPAGRIENSELSLETLHARAPNVRRRSYILIGKHRSSYDEHKEFLQSRMGTELDTYAREGLARTIAPRARFHPAMEQLVAEWFATEPLDIVRLALLPHIVVFAPRAGSYRAVLSRLLHESTDTLLRARCRALGERLPSAHFVNRLLSKAGPSADPPTQLGAHIVCRD